MSQLQPCLDDGGPTKISNNYSKNGVPYLCLLTAFKTSFFSRTPLRKYLYDVGQIETSLLNIFTTVIYTTVR